MFGGYGERVRIRQVQKMTPIIGLRDHSLFGV
jgi:hypothetical protein